MTAKDRFAVLFSDGSMSVGAATTAEDRRKAKMEMDDWNSREPKGRTDGRAKLAVVTIAKVVEVGDR